MIRRYSLRRSDNYPFVGTQTAFVSANSSVKVTTGHPMTSAIVSHLNAVPSSAMRIISQNIREHDLEAGIVGSNPLNMLFSKSEPVIVHSIGLDFSRGTMARQYELSMTINGNKTTFISSSNSTNRNLTVDGPFILKPEDNIRLFADIAEYLKSTSSSESTIQMSISSLSSTSFSSGTFTSVSSTSSSNGTSSFLSQNSTLSSVSSLSTLYLETSSSSSTTFSSLSSLSSESSSKNSSSSSTSSTNSSESSSSPKTSSSSSSSTSESSLSFTSVSSLSNTSSSSSSSTGNLRVSGWVKYTPCVLTDMAVSSSSEWDAAGSIKLIVSAYLDDGFMISVSGVSEPTYIDFSYMAI